MFVTMLFKITTDRKQIKIYQKNQFGPFIGYSMAHSLGRTLCSHNTQITKYVQYST